jgi:DNA gyrase/topoisomerase IV subunit B
MARKARTDRKLEDYSGLSDITHVYKIPDTYIGGCRKSNFKTYVYEDKKLIEKNLDIPQGVVRLFYEPMSNAGDNADASRRAGIIYNKLSKENFYQN